jgi:anti-sigma-K factor RskA
MNVEAYISSGVLERYVLGCLPNDETAAVEAQVARHAELLKVLCRLQDDYLAVLKKEAMAPAKDLEAAILQAIVEERAGNGVSKNECGGNPRKSS